MDFTSGSLLLAALLKPSGFSRSAVRSRWRTTFGLYPHIRATPPFAKIFDFVQNGSSWRAKSALLDFASGSSRATSFQKRLCTFSIPFGFHIGGFRSLTFASPYASFCQNLWFCAKWVLFGKAKSALLDFASGSLLLAALLKPSGFSRSAVHSRFTHSVRFHLTSVLRLLLSKSLIFSKMGPLGGQNPLSWNS